MKTVEEKMKKLDILASYIAHRIAVRFKRRSYYPQAILGETMMLTRFSNYDQTKLILYPLDLIKPIWYNGEQIVPKEEIIRLFNMNVETADLYDVIVMTQLSSAEHQINYDQIKLLSYRVIKKLLQWRINIYTKEELPANEWINVNKLKVNPYKET